MDVPHLASIVYAEIALVCKSGGMSLYSRTASDGIVIDLSEFSAVTHDKTKRQVELVGSVRIKEVAVELANDGFCTSMFAAIFEIGLMTDGCASQLCHQQIR